MHRNDAEEEQVKYSRFEWLTLTVGGLAIGGSIVASLGRHPGFEEIAAQLLLFVVLAAAVHFGRNGGFFAAVAATILYIAMRSPYLAGGITPDLLVLITIRMATYGVIGIVGGEVCGRMKYVMARLEGGVNVDEETHVYNEAYVGRLLTEHLGVHARYKAPFSIALLTLTPALTSELRPSRRLSLLRAVATHIRNDVRLVDDVGRLSDGRFVLIMPHTPKTGGEVAAERVRVGVRELLGARDESVRAQVLAAPEDLSELNRLRDELSTAAEQAA